MDYLLNTLLLTSEDALEDFSYMEIGKIIRRNAAEKKEPDTHITKEENHCKKILPIFKSVA